MNRYMQDFKSETRSRYNADSSDMTHGDWMCANTRLNKKPFSFKRYPFQAQIAADEHPNLDCIKPSQIGLTEVQIRKTFAWAKRTPNISIIYTMPSKTMFERIAKTRMLPILENDRAFRGDGGSMGLMKVGSSYVYVTGAAESDATSIDADIVMNDEVDLTDPTMLALFNSRLQGSDLRVNQRFSTPTYEGVGVHTGYQMSDQHRYLLKCQCCGEWQEPDFNREFVVIPNLPDAEALPDLTQIDQKVYDACKLGEYINRAYIKCQRCHKPLDMGDHENREWVAKYPSRTNSRGYQVLPFSTERLHVAYIIDQLLKYKNKNNMKGFYNTVLGRPFADDDVQLSKGLLRHAFTQNPFWVDKPQSGVFSVGIDVGKTCYLTVATPNGGHPMLVHFESCPQSHLMSRLSRLDELFSFKCGGIDWTPEWKLACEVRDWSRGRIMPVAYTEGKEVLEVKDMTTLITHIACNRTGLLDRVANGIRCGETTFSGYLNDATKETIVTHFRDMVREVDETSDQPPRWKKLSGNDHYFHAAAYATSGLVYHEVLNSIATPSKVGSPVVMQKPNMTGAIRQAGSLFGGRPQKTEAVIPGLVGRLR